MKKCYAITLAILCALTMQLAVAQLLPVYDSTNSELTIPVVNSKTTPGVFQNIKIRHHQGEFWRLTAYWEAVKFHSALIESVKLVTVGSQPPIQLYLEIKGRFYCMDPGNIVQALEDNKLKVNFYYAEYPYFTIKEPTICAASYDNFRKVVPLEVYGLPAGQYEYLLNGDFSGTFSFSQNNVLAE